MTPLFRRAAACAALAAWGWFPTPSYAQDTPVAAPERSAPVLRRALPAAPAPVVQQSPNGLYQLSITDSGIELHGPNGTVKINNQGIQIGGPGTMQINIESGDRVLLKGARNAEFQSGGAMTLKATGDVNVAGATLQVDGSAAVKISGGTASSLMAPTLTLGCAGGMPAVRVGDQVTIPPGGSTGIVAIGSPRVRIC